MGRAVCIGRALYLVRWALYHSPAVYQAVAVSQPSETGHLVAWRSTVEIDDDVIIGNEHLQTADDVADNMTSPWWLQQQRTPTCLVETTLY